MAEPVLKVEGLSKRYGSLNALAEVNLEIRPGEIFGLLGPNGAGKTTLIGCVAGLVKKTAGTIQLFGHDLDRDPIRPRYDLGLVPQEINFDPFFTVRESLRIQLGYFGKKPDPARIDELLAALDLSAKADARTRELSGGMKRRLLIAKALVHRPRLVFLDEPTAGVDVELRRDLWNYVRKLRAEGTTVILTTHYLEEAEELADRIGVINKGKLLLVENKDALMRRMGERTLTVQLSQAATLPAELAAAVTRSADGLMLTYVEREGARRCGDVLGALYRAGVPIEEVETRRSRLEEILLQVLHGGRA